MNKTYLVSLALVLLTACGASVSQGPANDRGLIDLNRELSALPTGGPSPYGSAYGARQGDFTVASADIDRYLKPDAKKPAAKRAIAPTVAAKAVAPAPAPAPVVVPEPAAEPVQLAAATTVTAPAEDDSQRYAAREQQPKARALENYKAGDAIVITSGALIIILLVVILVLLLT